VIISGEYEHEMSWLIQVSSWYFPYPFIFAITDQRVDVMVVVIRAGIMQATITAVCMASMASFVAFPAKSPFTICSILFLRCLISFFPNINGRIAGEYFDGDMSCFTAEFGSLRPKCVYFVSLLSYMWVVSEFKCWTILRRGGS
jgi:hypothetical protein